MWTTHNGSSSRAAICFFCGTALGAGVALLLAPQSGRRTRRMIHRKAEDGRDYLTKVGRDLSDKVSDLSDRGAEFAGETADVFRRIRHNAAR